jgi:hypothetical protein
MGLIAPAWRRWPQHFDVAAVCVGSVMPDVVDGIAGPFRGHLGQTVGHSFLGLVFLCVPGGVLLWWASIAAARRMSTKVDTGFYTRAWNVTRETLLDAPKASWRIVIGSLVVGDLSHMFFDVISHGEFPWLFPWFMDLKIYPNWWYTQWAGIATPLYEKPYPVGPHFMVWLALTFLGGYWLVRPILRPNKVP